MGSKQKREIPTNSNAAVEVFYPALHIPEILENIFQFCDEEDLQVCRLVSKGWNLASRKAWRATATVIINCVETSNKQNSMVKFLEYKDFAEEHGLFHHFDKFTPRFNAWKENLSIFNSFWERCGLQIKILRISKDVTLPTTASFGSILFQYCPNLEELHFEAVYISEYNSNNSEFHQTTNWTKPKCGENRNLRHLAFDPHTLGFSRI